MNPYELTYLISSELSEKEAQELQTKIISFAQEEGGVLVEAKSPLKKKIAYPIRKQSQVYLAIVNLQLLPEKLTNLEQKIKKEKEILRYIILSKKKLKKVPTALKKPTKITPKPKAKVELKEIEKKLEEILTDE